MLLFKFSKRIWKAILRNRLCLVFLVICFVLYSSYTLSTWDHAEKTRLGDVSVEELYQKARLSLNPRHICNCTFRVGPAVPENRKTLLFASSCSDEATLLGEFQKVVSYSLYRPPTRIRSFRVPLTEDFERKYFFGAPANVEGVKKYYPGWVMRIYSNIDLEPNSEMCDLICSDPIIYYCDTRRLPHLGSVEGIDPMRWRFLPIGDPTVEKFVVRDLDSRISQRERDAVSEWEANNFPFHGMRDHSVHRTYMMGGMWGGNNFKMGSKIARNLQTDFIHTLEPGNDQNILSALIYLKHKDKILTHDSFTCHIYKDSRPFPTMRENRQSFVGKRVVMNERKSGSPNLYECPLECRPPNHQDWEYC